MGKVDLDKAGFFAKTQSLKKDQMHEKLMQLFRLVEFADYEISGDYNWELAKEAVGLPSETSRTRTNLNSNKEPKRKL